MWDLWYHHSCNIKYLGINISPKLSKSLILLHLLKKVWDNLNQWSNLPVSLYEWRAIIKMSVLLKMNWLFSVIPISPNNTWFQSLNSTSSKFCWKNKTSHMKLIWAMQKSNSQRELEAPNSELYYVAGLSSPNLKPPA